MATPIDLTDRYEVYKDLERGGKYQWDMGAWVVEDRTRSLPQVQALVVHHWAGFYGPELTPAATSTQEIAQIDRCAADHLDRFGIGPGYNYIAFPSGRSYAVGKWSTHRAHTKGRAPASAIPEEQWQYWSWNWIGRAVAAAGSGNADDPEDKLEQAIKDCLDEMRALPEHMVHPDAPTYTHRGIPTVDSVGNELSQGTACPGDHLASLVRGGRFVLPSNGTPPTTVDSYQEGYQAGARDGAIHAYGRVVDLAEESLDNLR